jgi:hypothetical protein
MDEQAKSISTDLMGIYTELEQFLSIASDRPDQLELDVIFSQLKEINKLRVHHGRFYPKPNQQATTLRLFFECFDTCLRLKYPVTQLHQIDQELHPLLATIKKYYEHREEHTSLEKLRDYYLQLKTVQNVVLTAEMDAASRISRLMDTSRGFHMLTMLLLGIETVSESLMTLYASFHSTLRQLREMQVLALFQDPTLIDKLKEVMKQVQKLEASKNDQGFYFGDAAEIAITDVPLGQTIIKSLLAECECRIAAMQTMI